MAHHLTVACKATKSPLVTKTLEILARVLKERGAVKLKAATARGRTAPQLVLAVEPGIGKEGFRIDPDPAGAWRVTGNDERGLLYGVGKFLRGCRFGVGADGSLCGGIDYLGWTGTDVPQLPVRGMYFASHFHNFYHEAPIAAVERYIEDLALWGCNALSVWFDMHHYSGIQDPAAQAMIQRLHAFLRAANSVGMGAGLTTLANEAYNTSPPELRAEPFPHHYHVELCPSKPAGLDLIIKWRREMLQAFADLEIEYVWIWPYDQGGCKCADCKPWGGNGFVRSGQAEAQVVREIMPRAKTVVSTWEFGYWEGDAEWDRFYAALSPRADWVDSLMCEAHGDFPAYILKHGPPAGYPVLNFPEISMSGMWPWGAFGANLQPQRLQKVWNTCRQWLSGGFPYSEGIFEDLNKAVCLQLYWNPERRVEDIVREYAAAEFAPAVAADVQRAVYLLEANMKHGVKGMDQSTFWKAGQTLAEGTDAMAIYDLPQDKDVETPFALLDAANRRLTPQAAKSWRWRLLWLRAAFDRELRRSGGRLTDQADAWFSEVRGISALEHAEFAVAALGRQDIQRLFPPPAQAGGQ